MAANYAQIRRTFAVIVAAVIGFSANANALETVNIVLSNKNFQWRP